MFTAYPDTNPGDTVIYWRLDGEPIDVDVVSVPDLEAITGDDSVGTIGDFIPGLTAGTDTHTLIVVAGSDRYQVTRDSVIVSVLYRQPRSSKRSRIGIVACFGNIQEVVRARL